MAFVDEVVDALGEDDPVAFLFELFDDFLEGTLVLHEAVFGVGVVFQNSGAIRFFCSLFRHGISILDTYMEGQGPIISMIAAIQRSDRGIGKDGDLLWKLPGDLQHFKSVTTGHPVIMGRNTYYSIGRPLPGRTNIVLSETDEEIPGCVVCGSLEEAFRVAGEEDGEEIFVIGGGQVYREALPHAEKLYLTLVDSNEEADTFFPEFDEFKNPRMTGKGKDNGVQYTFWEFMR